ncbi:MAG: hypothetical protein Q9227_009311 [Pyrenula ochraceoflavens]
MSESGKLKAPKKEADAVDSTSLESFAKEIVDQSIMNILYGVVSEAHQEVKTGRTIAVLYDAQKKAEDQSNAENTKDSSSANASRAPTPTLTENPMLLTREERCPNCLLPRLFRDPFSMTPSQRQKYCGKAPIINRPEHDVHGNLFFENVKGKKKKPPKQAQQQISAAASPDSSSTSPPATPATGSFSNSTGLVEIQNKEHPPFPHVKCPNTKCTRYIIVHRLASHIESCLFNKGRKAAKDAADRLEASSSRAGTPKPDGPVTSGVKRAREDDTLSVVVKKKKKTDPSPKKKDGAPHEKSGANQPSKLQNGESVDDIDSRPRTPTPASKAEPEDSIKVDSSGKKGNAQKPRPVNTAAAETASGGKNPPKSGGGLKGSGKFRKEKVDKGD